MLANELVVEQHRNYREERVERNRDGGRYGRDVMNAWSGDY
jgi:hypothetical protein